MRVSGVTLTYSILSVGVIDLDADLLDDRLAELEAVADRPVGLVEEGERRRGLAIAQPHHVASP